jgi:hypothetical protein
MAYSLLPSLCVLIPRTERESHLSGVSSSKGLISSSGPYPMVSSGPNYIPKALSLSTIRALWTKALTNEFCGVY